MLQHGMSTRFLLIATIETLKTSVQKQSGFPLMKIASSLILDGAMNVERLVWE